MGMYQGMAPQVRGEVSEVGVYTMSIHRNTEILLFKLRQELAPVVDVLITGAGWANHLTGTCDAYLRYTLRNDHVVVVGVAFEDANEDQHTVAAMLSIKAVPGTQVVYRDEQGKQFVGYQGFADACRFAASGQLPVIKLPEAKSPLVRTLEEAIKFSQESQNKT
jgi:hypothetical protein